MTEAMEQTLVNWGLVTGGIAYVIGLAHLRSGPEGFAYRQRWLMGKGWCDQVWTFGPGCCAAALP